MILRVKVTPNAKRDELLGWEDNPQGGRYLRVRLQAPPVDGKANKALVAFLAKRLEVPKSAITLLKGQSSRLKTLEVPDDAKLP
jgi:uncharacterized protein (TIGR00251 family)